MINNDLINYISAQRQIGKNDIETKNTLLANGWIAADIDEAINYSPNLPHTTVLDLSFISLMKESISIYRKNFKAILSILIIPILSPLLISIFAVGFGQITRNFANIPNTGTTLLTVGLILLFVVVVSLFFLASQIALIYLISHHEQNPSIKECFQAARPKLAAYFFLSLMVSLAFLGGVVLFILPGIILSIWFSFSYFILVNEGLKGTQAMAKSREYIKGHSTPVFMNMLGLGLIILVLSIPGYIVTALSEKNIINGVESTFNTSTNLVWGVLSPIVTIFLFLIYKRLKDYKGQVTPTLGKKTIWAFIVLGVIGILASIGFIFFLIFFIISGLNRVNPSTLNQSQNQMMVDPYPSQLDNIQPNTLYHDTRLSDDELPADSNYDTNYWNDAPNFLEN